MTEQDFKRKALDARQSGEFDSAGDYYTIAAHRGYARSLPDAPQFGAGLVQLQRAAICYGLAGQGGRRVNRCRQGVLIAEDMIDRVFEQDPQQDIDRARRGVWYEHLGDFRLIGEFDDPSEAYNRAIDVYEEAGDPDTFYAEQEQFPLMEHLTSIAEAVGRSLDQIDAAQNDLTMTDWVCLKREEYPDLLESLYDRGEWP